MLQNLWTGDIPVFIDMSHYEYSDSLRFAKLHQCHSAVFYLRNTSRSGIVFLIIKGLNRIHNQDIRFQLVDCIHNIRKPCFGEYIQRVWNDAKSLRPKFELSLAFFPGDIQDLSSSTQTAADLQKQGRFSDSGCASDQNQGTQNGTTAKYPVQFSHSGRKSQFTSGGYFADFLRFTALSHRSSLCSAGRGWLFNVFLYGVPGTAGRTFPLPSGCFISTVGAVKNCFCLGHRKAP